jgi:exosortase E/protease (VPEID-CTERM system)
MATWLFFLGVVAAEITLLRHFSTLKYTPLRESSGSFEQILFFLPAVIKSILFTGSATLIALFAGDRTHAQAAIYADRPNRFSVVVNLTSFAALIGIFAMMDANEAAGTSGWYPNLLRATPIFWFGMLLSWAGFVAPFSLWRRTIACYAPVLGIVFIAAIISFHQLDINFTSYAWTLLTEPTLFLSSQLYALTGGATLVAGITPEGYPIYGSDGYFGIIEPGCSGYQGMVLVATLLGVYFYLEPRKISALKMALVILLSCVAIFLLNGARLALLIYIGVHISPEVAQQGFHVNFGLLSLVMVLALAVASTRAFTAPKTTAAVSSSGASYVNFEGGTTARLLIPLIYLIGSSLIVGLFSGKFFWFYPLPVLAAIGGLLQIRAEMRGLKLTFTRAPFFLAVATFLVWLYLVAPDPQAAEVIQISLFAAPFPVIVVWLLARLLGAVIIVPLVEELAFRGTFNAMLYARLRSHWTGAAAQAGAIALTAVFFGLVHSNVLAGTIAGLAFGLARWRRNDLGDAILCHGLTNLMLSFYILLTGEWSYWL